MSIPGEFCTHPTGLWQQPGETSSSISATVAMRWKVVQLGCPLKKPKLELVSALSETKRLFWLVYFCTETESFDVSIEPTKTEYQPKQFDREHILQFFTENLVVFRFFPFFGFLVCFETVCFGCFASIPKQRASMFQLNRNKQRRPTRNRNLFLFVSGTL